MIKENIINGEVGTFILNDENGNLLYHFFGNLYNVFKDAEMWRANYSLLKNLEGLKTPCVNAKIDSQKLDLRYQELILSKHSDVSQMSSELS